MQYLIQILESEANQLSEDWMSVQGEDMASVAMRQAKSHAAARGKGDYHVYIAENKAENKHDNGMPLAVYYYKITR